MDPHPWGPKTCVSGSPTMRFENCKLIYRFFFRRSRRTSRTRRRGWASAATGCRWPRWRRSSSTWGRRRSTTRTNRRLEAAPHGSGTLERSRNKERSANFFSYFATRNFNQLYPKHKINFSFYFRKKNSKVFAGLLGWSYENLRNFPNIQMCREEFS